MEAEIANVLALIVTGILLSWLFRRFRLSDIVGYVVGGAIATAALAAFGINIESSFSYIEPLEWLGLTLFSFTIGASIGFQKIAENLRRAIAIELIACTVLWIATGFIAWAARLEYADRTAFFILLVNSSTIALATLEKRHCSVSEALIDRAILLTNIEDALQFILFTLLFIAGTSLTRNLVQATIQAVAVIGLTAILFTLGKNILRFLSKTKFMVDKENKFVLTVGTAMLFTLIASVAGLPSLFGAFIAGTAFSLYFSLEDISDMINGLKNVGLLLYFTSIGAQVCLKTMVSGSQQIILLGVILGLIAYAARFFGLFIGTLLTEGRISDSATLALHLGLLSETGIFFMDTLAKEGLISNTLVLTSTVAILSSTMLFGVLAPRISTRTGLLEKVAPCSIIVFFNKIGIFYMKRIDVAIAMLTPLIRFTAVTLAMTYLNSLVLNAVDFFKLPLVAAVAGSISFSAILIVAFMRALQSILNTLLSLPSKPAKAPSIAFNMMLDFFTWGLAVTLQTYIFYETTQRVLLSEAILSYITIAAEIVSISALIYGLVKYYFKLREYERNA